MHFWRALVENNVSFIVWFGSCNAADKKRLESKENSRAHYRGHVTFAGGTCVRKDCPKELLVSLEAQATRQMIRVFVPVPSGWLFSPGIQSQTQPFQG